MTLPPIDFKGLAAALLDRAEQLVPEWLREGRRRGAEWVCGNLAGGKGSSCSVNLRTGAWADFSGEDAGSDLISLYAAIHGIEQGKAAVELMDRLGWQRAAAGPPDAGTRAARLVGAAPPPAPARSASPAPADEKRRTTWRAIRPVPPEIARPNFERLEHWHHGRPSRVWAYELGGQLQGYVCRFDKGEGEKEILPLTWCVDDGDERGLRKWHWKQWEEPRPLYLPAGELHPDPARVPVVLVEGEKCADALHGLLGAEFDAVTWPGGSKAWAKVDLQPLAGRVVILWPDCDAKRWPLTKAERAAGVAEETKDIKPEANQPGVAAMVGIGNELAARLGCAVSLCRIPAPGAVPDGWDVSDAIAEGWDAQRVRDFIRAAVPFVPPDEPVRAAAEPVPTPGDAGAGDGEGDSDAITASGWKLKLLRGPKGAIAVCRENAVLALDGVAAGEGRPWIGGVREVAGAIAFNEFTSDIEKLRPMPWGTPAGSWDEVDELLMGEWLVREHWLPSMPRGTLEEAVRMVAYRHKFHPVRQYLRSLRWDGAPRLATWLRRTVLEEDEYDDADPLQRYLARAGTWYVQGMCARVMQPGVKFDYMLILEGRQGKRKSSLFAALAGEWFADTGLVLGEKDSYQQLQGRWLYEIPELDAFSKTDVTKIKAFIASPCDYFRASYDKRARKYPRQLVFGGTTNETHYLTDTTGNRRFWPVRVTREEVDIEGVLAERDQLLAEAMQRIADGKRMHPTRREEVELFEPQQREREVENSIQAAISRWMTDDAEGQLCTQVTLIGALAKIGIGIEKLGPGRYHEKQAGAALRRLGWIESRPKGDDDGRPRVFHRPGSAGALQATTTPTHGDDQGGRDGLPF